MSSPQVETRRKIVNKFLENPGCSGRSIAKALKLPQKTVSRVLKRFKETQSVERKPGSGRKPGLTRKELSLKIVRSIKQNPGLSDADRAQKFGISRSLARKIRLRAGYKAYHAVKCPNRSSKQCLVAKKRARLLYKDYLTKPGFHILLDDETYAKCDSGQMPGLKFYYSTFRGNVSDKYKFVLHDKYAKKLMIWQGLCSCGLRTRPFVTSATMTSDLYIKECLQKRLLPLIRLHSDPVVFWPDLASCHYSKATMEWYAKNKIMFVPKEKNPPNCPELRPIERYWALVKRSMKKSGGVSSDIKAMTRTWNKHASKITKEGVQKLMGGIKTKTRKFFMTGNM